MATFSPAVMDFSGMRKNPVISYPDYQGPSIETWASKYQLRDSKGNNIDKSMKDTFIRVAKQLALAEINPDLWVDKFIKTMENGAIPAGRIMANMGAGEYKPSTSAINCTVSQIVEDGIHGILEATKQAGLTLSAGCGIGYEFSTLRPRGAFVQGAGASTSGSLSFMDIFNSMCFTIASAGGRRGAQMATFAVWHPDIEAFIDSKRKDGAFRQFNLSLLIDDEFMDAVKNDKEHHLVFPIKKRDLPDVEQGLISVIEKKRFWEKAYCEKEDYVLTSDDKIVCKVFKTMKASALWDKIMKSTYDYAEPGFLLIDEINRMNPLHFIEEVRATNPSLVAGTLVHTKSGIFPIESLENKRFKVRAKDGSWGDAECWKSGDSEKTITINFGSHMETTATPKHKWPVLKNGKIERTLTSDLKVGDFIPKNLVKPLEISGDPSLTEDDGFFLGVWLADGHASYRSNGVLTVGFTFNKQDQDMAEKILSYVNSHKENKSSLRERSSSLEFSFQDKGFVDDIKNKFGIDAGEKKFPEVIWKSNDFFVKGFVDGFISGDGYVGVDEKNNKGRIIVTQKNKDILVELSKLLSFCGITSSITSSESTKVSFPNGKNYNKTYKRSDLLIGTDSIRKFNQIFSLTCKRKADKITKISSFSKKKKNTKDEYLQIESLTENTVGVGVWDIAVDHEDHLFPIQWGYTGNCGEQPLPPNGACLLGSLIVVKYIKNPFQDNMYFDWDSYKEDIKIFTRMLDNVVEFNGLPLKEQRDEIESKRRHGMGLTGIGSAMSILGMKYGSKESVEFVDTLMKLLVVEGFKEGISLAEEKGMAPIFKEGTNLQQWVNSPYMQKVWNVAPELKELALNKGCRFTHHSSIAPTGTLSLTFGNNVSNGIEPTFTHKYTRNIIKEGKKAKVDEIVYSYEALLYKHITGKEVPTDWSTTDSILPADHVKIQATAQYWLDSACSKTINIPSDFSFEKFKDVYLDAYNSKLKGCTTYRFNPEAFSGVLVKSEDLESTKYTFQLEDGTKVTGLGNDRVVYEGEEYSVQNLFDSYKEGYYGKL